MAAASTLNATTADVAQFFVGSTAATGAFNSNSSVTANLEVVSNLRLEAPLVRCDPTAPWLSIEGNAPGRPGQRHAAGQRGRGAGGQPRLPLPLRRHRGAGDEHQVCGRHGARRPRRLLRAGRHQPGAHAGGGGKRLFLATQNSAGGNGALANGGVQLNALDQNIALNTTNGTANLVIEPNHRGIQQRRGDMFLLPKPLGREAQDERPAAVDGGAGALRRRGGQELYDGAAKQTGFVAQEVYECKSFCKLKNFEDRELMTLDYQRMTAVLWQTCKSLQRRIEKLEKKKRGAIGLMLLRQINMSREKEDKANLDLACEAVLNRASEHNLVVLLDKWSTCWKHRGRIRAIGPFAYEKYSTLGFYGHGGVFGISKASEMKQACLAVIHLFPTVKVCTSHNIRHVNCNKTDASVHSRTPSFVAERGKSREFCQTQQGCTHPALTAHRHLTHIPPRHTVNPSVLPGGRGGRKTTTHQLHTAKLCMKKMIRSQSQQRTDMLSQESQELHTAKSSTIKYGAWHTTCGQKTVWEIKCCLASEKAYLFPTVKVCTSHNIRHVNCNKTDASVHSRTPSFVAERGKSREFCKHNKGGTHPALTAHRHLTHIPLLKGDDGQERVRMESTKSAK